MLKGRVVGGDLGSDAHSVEAAQLLLAFCIFLLRCAVASVSPPTYLMSKVYVLVLGRAK